MENYRFYTGAICTKTSSSPQKKKLKKTEYGTPASLWWKIYRKPITKIEKSLISGRNVSRRT